MSREYCFNLSVPLGDADRVDELLDQARQNCLPLRISRKPDRGGKARYYLSFPFSDSRPDLRFEQWFSSHLKDGWELFGPHPGRWGLS